MYYFIQDTFRNIFTEYNLESMITAKEKADNSEIELDLYSRTQYFRMPGIQKTVETNYLSDKPGEDPIRNTYMQGDVDGSNLQFILGTNPLYDENDPEDSFESHKDNIITSRAAYVDSNGKPSGLTLLYRKDKPNQWLIIVTTNTHLPKDKRECSILSSINLNLLKKKNEISVTSPESPVKSLTEKAGFPILDILLHTVLDVKTGRINIHADIFIGLFSGVFQKKVPFDDNIEWMNLLKERAADIIKNSVLVGFLDLQLDLQQAGMTPDIIRKCLDEDDDLTVTLSQILAEPSDEITKKSRVALAINLYKLGYTHQLPKFDNDPQSTQFFNTLAQDSKNHPLLKKILISFEDTPDRLWVLRLINKCPDSELLFTKLGEIEPKNPGIFATLTWIEEYFKNNPTDNPNVLRLSLHVILACPEIKMSYSTPDQINDFLNLKGVEKINPELLVQLIRNNNYDLINSVSSAIRKLTSLGIEHSEPYELAINMSKDGKLFRSGIQKLDAKKVDLFVSLHKLNQVSNFYSLVEKRWEEPFNQLVQVDTVKEILNENLSKKDPMEACKPLLENTALIALTSAKISLTKDQINELLDTTTELSISIGSILKSTDLATKKNELYQLAIELHHLNALNLFRSLQEENIDFLKKFHHIAEVIKNKPSLKGVLSKEDALKVLTNEPGGIKLLRENDVTDEMIKALSELASQNINPPKIKSIAIKLLFQNKNISIERLNECVTFMQGIEGANWNYEEWESFLLNHYNNKKLQGDISDIHNRLRKVCKIPLGFLQYFLRNDQKGEQLRETLKKTIYNSEITADEIKLAENLALLDQLDKYSFFLENKNLIQPFNNLGEYPHAMEILQEKLSKDHAKIGEIFENKRLTTLFNSKICPSPYQIKQLLQNDSPQSKAMDQLLTLHLEDQTAKKLAYKWAFLDTPTSNYFKKCLEKIANNGQITAQAIETLCLLQLESKNGFQLIVDNPQSKVFIQSILLIEEKCTSIRTRLLEESPDKAKQFANLEQNYRKCLYEEVYNRLTETKKKQQPFATAIEKKSANMLKVVDTDRHPWVMEILRVLTNVINIFFGTLPSHILRGKSVFFQNTESGKEVRDLHQSLDEKLIQAQSEPKN